VDEDGHAILADFRQRLALHHFSFKTAITTLAFSPSGRHFAVGLGRVVQIWHSPLSLTPESEEGHEFAPFILHRSYSGHHDVVNHIHWSRDSRYLLSAGKDLTARIWSLDHEQNFVPTTLAGHREGLLGAWFSGDEKSVFMTGKPKDGADAKTLPRFTQ
jgi:periodic tryptophan protein 2